MKPHHFFYLSIKTFLVLYFIFSYFQLSAQEFRKIDDIEMPSGQLGVASWLDFNADGYYDVFLTGTNPYNNFQFARLNLSDQENNFYNAELEEFTKVIYNGYDAGDINNDGHLDFIYTGTTSGHEEENIFRFYKNIGDTAVAEIPQNFTPLTDCYVKLIDIDCDGLQDVYYHGIDSSDSFVMECWQNLGQENFQKVDINIDTISGSRTNFSRNSALWADFNNDGLMDVVVAMSTYQDFSLSLYENKGDFIFEKKDFILPDMSYVSMDAGDINQDGLLDIVIAGSDRNYLSAGDIGASIYVLINIGDFRFLKHDELERMGIFYNTLELGDINNDGYLDLMFYGAGGSFRSFKLYLNDQQSHFIELENNVGQPHLGGSHFGDFDNDNDLDLLVYGEFDLDPGFILGTYVFENLSESTNQPPNPPGLLDIQLFYDELNLFWDDGNDDFTKKESLCYNLRFGTPENPNQYLSSLSTENKLKIVYNGNQQLNHQYLVKNILPGNYTAGIQSIDHSFNASTMKDIEFCIQETTYFHGDSIYFCKGDTVQIDVPGKNQKYLWSNGSSDSVLQVTEAGFYHLTLTHENGCSSFEYFNLLEKETPIFDLGADTSVFLGNSIYLNPEIEAEGYLWSDQSTTEDFLFNSGDYGLGEQLIHLQITDINGCQFSDSISIEVKAKPEPDFLQFKVFPNPFYDEILISSSKSPEGLTNFKLYDLNGKLIINKNRFLEGNEHQLNTQNLADGTYYLKIEIEHAGYSEVFQLVKIFKYKSLMD